MSIAAVMSIPSCIRPQRVPKPLDDRAGDRPAEDAVAAGGGIGGVDELDSCWLCADLRRERRARGPRAPRSPRGRRPAPSSIEASVADLACSAATSASRLATRRMTTPRCSVAAASAAASSRAASRRAMRVCRRASRTPSRAPFTCAAIRLSCRPMRPRSSRLSSRSVKLAVAEHERDEVGPVAHVELADAELESPERGAVLPPETREPRGLRRRCAGRACRGACAARESVPSSTSSRACSALTPAWSSAHAAGDRAQLLGEDARAVLGVRRAVAQLAELAVDPRLLARPGRPPPCPQAAGTASRTTAAAADSRPRRRITATSPRPLGLLPPGPAYGAPRLPRAARRRSTLR